MSPTQLQIATSSLSRLVKEEQTYHTELVQQQKAITQLEKTINDPEPEDERGNRAYSLKQQQRALEETKAVLPTMRERITSAREKLESLLDTATDSAEREKAMQVLKLAKEVQKDDPDSAKPEEVVPAAAGNV